MKNETESIGITSDDATWILTSSFVIFTMQTGFGLLESGVCAKKNEVNIMMKNVVDVVLGGLFYWSIGYGLQFGTDPGTTLLYGWGSWFLDGDGDQMGQTFAEFIFQLSFCTTATTIVSGSMAERTNYNAYILFSLLNTIVYCVPAGWVWRESGFLHQMGSLDFAGTVCVHFIGGVSGFVAAYMLKPRIKRYEKGTGSLPMGNPTNAIAGTFALWWGWLGFNCGSTFGISNNKWQFAQRAAVTTLNASFSGGILAIIYSYIVFRTFDPSTIANGILAGLVAVTGGAGFYETFDAFIIGAIGSLLCCLTVPLMDRFHIDDPVGAVAVHGSAGMWGGISVGLFATAKPHILADGGLTRGQCGLIKGCGVRLLRVQAVTVISLGLWSGVTTWILLALIDKVIPVRMCIEEELLGADFWIHGIRHDVYDYKFLLKEIIKQGMDIGPQLEKIGKNETTIKWTERLITKYMEMKDAELCYLRKRKKSRLVRVKNKVLALQFYLKKETKSPTIKPLIRTILNFEPMVQNESNYLNQRKRPVVYAWELPRTSNHDKN